jgi:hypothetical protein
MFLGLMISATQEGIRTPLNVICIGEERKVGKALFDIILPD